MLEPTQLVKSSIQLARLLFTLQYERLGKWDTIHPGPHHATACAMTPQWVSGGQSNQLPIYEHTFILWLTAAESHSLPRNQLAQHAPSSTL